MGFHVQWTVLFLARLPVCLSGPNQSILTRIPLSSLCQPRNKQIARNGSEQGGCESGEGGKRVKRDGEGGGCNNFLDGGWSDCTMYVEGGLLI